MCWHDFKAHEVCSWSRILPQVIVVNLQNKWLLTVFFSAETGIFKDAKPKFKVVDQDRWNLGFNKEEFKLLLPS